VGGGGNDASTRRLAPPCQRRSLSPRLAPPAPDCPVGGIFFVTRSPLICIVARCKSLCRRRRRSPRVASVVFTRAARRRFFNLTRSAPKALALPLTPGVSHTPSRRRGLTFSRTQRRPLTPSWIGAHFPPPPIPPPSARPAPPAAARNQCSAAWLQAPPGARAPGLPPLLLLLLLRFRALASARWELGLARGAQVRRIPWFPDRADRQYRPHWARTTFISAAGARRGPVQAEGAQSKVQALTSIPLFSPLPNSNNNAGRRGVAARVADPDNEQDLWQLHEALLREVRGAQGGHAHIVCRGRRVWRAGAERPAGRRREVRAERSSTPSPLGPPVARPASCALKQRRGPTPTANRTPPSSPPPKKPVPPRCAAPLGLPLPSPASRLTGALLLTSPSAQPL